MLTYIYIERSPDVFSCGPPPGPFGKFQLLLLFIILREVLLKGMPISPVLPDSNNNFPGYMHHQVVHLRAPVLMMIMHGVTREGVPMACLYR